MTKKCRTCGKEKPLDEFHCHPSTKDRRVQHCKPCVKIRSAAWYKVNAGRVQKYARDNRQRIEETRMARKYGLTRDAYDQMVAGQSSLCKICGEKKKLFVDHCHRTNGVRGLLCCSCNQAIGLFYDNPEICLNAAQYLRRSGE